MYKVPALRIWKDIVSKIPGGSSYLTQGNEILPRVIRELFTLTSPFTLIKRQPLIQGFNNDGLDWYPLPDDVFTPINLITQTGETILNFKPSNIYEQDIMDGNLNNNIRVSRAVNIDNRSGNNLASSYTFQFRNGKRFLRINNPNQSNNSRYIVNDFEKDSGISITNFNARFNIDKKITNTSQSPFERSLKIYTDLQYSTQNINVRIPITDLQNVQVIDTVNQKEKEINDYNTQFRNNITIIPFYCDDVSKIDNIVISTETLVSYDQTLSSSGNRITIPTSSLVNGINYIQIPHLDSDLRLELGFLDTYTISYYLTLQFNLKAVYTDFSCYLENIEIKSLSAYQLQYLSEGIVLDSITGNIKDIDNINYESDLLAIDDKFLYQVMLYVGCLVLNEEKTDVLNADKQKNFKDKLDRALDRLWEFYPEPDLTPSYDYEPRIMRRKNDFYGTNIIR